jgi:hypothetical protein
MWDIGSTCDVAGKRLGVKLPGIHSFKAIATAADANAGPEDCHLFSRAMNYGDPKFFGRAFFYQNCWVHLAVTVKISFQIGRVHAKGEVILFSE